MYIYKPVKLNEVKINVFEIHGQSSKKININNDEDYTILLEELDKINIKDIEKYTYSLNRRKITKFIYLISKVSEEKVIEKIFMILTYRANDTIVNTLWVVFQKNYKKNLFRETFQKFIINYNQKIFNGDYKETIIECLKKENFLNELVQLVNKKNFTIEQIDTELNLKHELLLFNDLFKEILMNCNKEFFERLDNGIIFNIISTCEFDYEKGIIGNYLHQMELVNYNAEILNFVYEKHNKPEEKLSWYWDNMSDLAIEKYKKWLIRHTIDIFFTDEARAIYWRRKVELIEDIVFLKKNEQLFMYFNRFVVTEFGRKGNAVYFYDKQLFNNIFQRYVNEKSSKSNDFYKEKSKMITKINHAGNWERKVDRLLRRLLR